MTNTAKVAQNFDPPEPWECLACHAENPGDEGCCYNCGADND
jgi:hypothetical protein